MMADEPCFAERAAASKWSEREHTLNMGQFGVR
jgi:hypothetical protein